MTLFGGDFLGQILAADSLPGAFVHSRFFLREWQSGGGKLIPLSASFGERALKYVPPPPKSHDTFCPPFAAFRS